MISSEAQRTLVKSPPELWAELSDPASLGRHLEGLGDIRIVRCEPESTVEWEAEGVSGAVELKPSGWGTKVTLTATRQLPEPPAPPEPEPPAAHEPEPVVEAAPEPPAAPKPEPEPVVEAAPEPQLGLFARIFRRRRRVEPACEPEPAREPEPEPPAAHEPEPEPKAQKQEQEQEQEQSALAAELQALEGSMAAETAAVLTAVLDRLGAAHHRPFSRA